MKVEKALQILLLTALLITGGVLTGNTAEAGKQDFTIVNFSGKTIYHLYVSRSDHSNWEEDLLGRYDTIKHGDSKKITFSSREDGKFWDIKVVFKNGREWVWNGVDLETVYRIRIDGKGTAHYN